MEEFRKYNARDIALNGLKKLNMQPKSDSYKLTWVILMAVKSIQAGKNKLAIFLKGSKSKQAEAISEAIGYGGLMWHNIETIKHFICQVENIGLIKRKTISNYPYDYTIYELTGAGKLVLEEKKEVPLQIIKISKPETVGDSEMATLSLFRQGKAIIEIASERSLTVPTVYVHLSRLILYGHVKPNEAVSNSVIIKVNDAASKMENPSVKLLKEALPEISYEEIRCALAGLKIANSEKIEE